MIEAGQRGGEAAGQERRGPTGSSEERERSISQASAAGATAAGVPGDRPPVHSALERTLPRDYYFAQEFFRQEKERIFCREWFCAGREEHLPEPGDYRLLDVVGESVLVVRTRTGELTAHYNVCRHRGCRLVLDSQRPGLPRSASHDGRSWIPASNPGAPDGIAERQRLVGTEAHGTSSANRPGPSGSFAGTIRCPYHSWTYNLDGTLRTAPFLDEKDEFYKSEFSLYPVGLETWGGFIFLNLSPAEASRDGRTLLSQLGAVPERLQRYPLAELRTAHRIVYEVAANWKVMLENYNECYHCAGVHPELCRVVPAFKHRGGSELDWDRGIPHRDGAWTFTHSGTTDRTPFGRLNEDERVRHKGELIYPNFMLSLSAEHVAAFTLWPHGPERTTIICDFLFHPSEMAKPTFDPSDAVDFWDLVNRQDWTICEGVQQGMRSRVFEFGYYAPMESASLDIRRYIGERLESGMQDAGGCPHNAPLPLGATRPEPR